MKNEEIFKVVLAACLLGVLAAVTVGLLNTRTQYSGYRELREECIDSCSPLEGHLVPLDVNFTDDETCFCLTKKGLLKKSDI